jgi:hypothetical protein
MTDLPHGAASQANPRFAMDRVLNGIIPLTFLALSLSAFVLLALSHVIRRLRKTPPATIPLAASSARRLSTHSRSRGSDASIREAISTKGPRAISEAENEVILGIVHEQSPDLTLEDVIDLGVGSSTTSRGSNSLSAGSAIAEEAEVARTTASMMMRSLLATKKDLFNVIGASGLLALLVLHFQAERSVQGANWTVFNLTAWVRLLLSCTK